MSKRNKRARKRDDSAAEMLGSSVRYLDGAGVKGSKPRPFSAELAMRQFHSWAYAAGNRNATAFASVPRRLYVMDRPAARKLYQTRPVSKSMVRYLCGENRANRPSEYVRRKAAQFAGNLMEVVEPHQLLLLMQEQNKDTNGYESDMLKMYDWQFAGNHYEFVAINRLGVPGQIWRMPPQWTKVIPNKKPIDSLVAGYLYGAGSETEKTYGADEVDHYKYPSPQSNIFYGSGWVEAAWTAIGLHNSKRESDTSTFDNYARPDWLLSIINGANKDMLDRLDSGIKQKLQGPGKRGRFLTTGGDVKATALQWQIEEYGTPTRIIEEIAAASGVPVAMLLSNDPNKANSQTATLSWLRGTIQPYCHLDDEMVNQKYVARWPDAEEMFVAHDPVAFEDREAEQRRHVGLVAGGILTPNEARAELGYEPVDGGDILHAPVGGGGGAGASATGGDMMPGQNDRRTNED